MSRVVTRTSTGVGEKTRSPAVTARNNGAKTPQAADTKKAPGKVTPEERYRMIAEAAYFRAQQRGFEGGDPAKDWLEAEAEIDRKLAGK